MSLIGYARVSTQDQHLEAQTDDLSRAGCERIFADKVSGKLASRPEFDKCLEYLRQGDVLVITKLDRLGRSVKNLIEITERLSGRGIDLRVLHQGIDSSTAGGMLFFHIMAGIAEFERVLISERTKDGLAAARARGRKGGRPARLNEKQIALMLEQWDHGNGKNPTELAELFDVGRTTVYRVIQGASGSSSNGSDSSAIKAPSSQRR